MGRVHECMAALMYGQILSYTTQPRRVGDRGTPTAMMHRYIITLQLEFVMVLN